MGAVLVPVQAAMCGLYTRLMRVFVSIYSVCLSVSGEGSGLRQHVPHKFGAITDGHTVPTLPAYMQANETSRYSDCGLHASTMYPSRVVSSRCRACAIFT